MFLLRTLISITQNQKVVKISGKRYDPYNFETLIFTLFTGLTKHFLQFTPGIERGEWFKFT